MRNSRTSWIYLDKETLAIAADVWATACINDSDILSKLKRARHELLANQDPKQIEVCQKFEHVYESIVEHVERYQATHQISNVNLAQEQDHE